MYLRYSFSVVAPIARSSPRASAGADQRVQLVDEQDDLAFRLGNLLEHGLQPVFELAAILGAGDQRRQVQRHNPLGLEHLGNIPGDDPLRQPFDDGGLAHAGIADQHRVVLRAPGQDLHHAADLVIAANHRIELAAASKVGEVPGVLLERAIGGFRRGRSHAVAATDRGQRLQDSVVGGAVTLQDLRSTVVLQPSDGQKQMLGRNVFVLELAGLVKRPSQHRFGGGAQVLLGKPGDFRKTLQASGDVAGQNFRANTETNQQRRNNAVGLLDQSREQM